MACTFVGENVFWFWVAQDFFCVSLLTFPLYTCGAVTVSLRSELITQNLIPVCYLGVLALTFKWVTGPILSSVSKPVVTGNPVELGAARTLTGEART